MKDTIDKKDEQIYNRYRELAKGRACEERMRWGEAKTGDETSRQIYALRAILIEEIRKALRDDPKLDPEVLRVEKQRWARQTYNLKLFRLYLPTDLLTQRKNSNK